MYDANLTYEENYTNGPFPFLLKENKFPKIKYLNKPKYQFLGIPLHIPFGVPAGPLINSKYVQVALDAGFCFPIYKTVRSQFWPCNSWPNILSVQSHNNFLNAKEKNEVFGTPFHENNYKESQTLSISNSFGVPSQIPQIWSEDFYSLKNYSEKLGYHIGLSFQGSKKNAPSEKEGQKLFFEDTQQTYEQAMNAVTQTGFHLLEVNLSCPNEKSVPIYKNLPYAIKLLSEIKRITKQNNKIKLIAKIGVLSPEETNYFMSESNQYIDGISAINTISADILSENKMPALGNGSISGGVCGKLILNEGLKMSNLLAETRLKLGLKKENFGLIGVGGVMNTNNFNSYLNTGVDVVQAATGMMWNLNFANEVASCLGVTFTNDGENNYANYTSN